MCVSVCVNCSSFPSVVQKSIPRFLLSCLYLPLHFDLQQILQTSFQPVAQCWAPLVTSLLPACGASGSFSIIASVSSSLVPLLLALSDYFQHKATEQKTEPAMPQTHPITSVLTQRDS